MNKCSGLLPVSEYLNSIGKMGIKHKFINDRIKTHTSAEPIDISSSEYDGILFFHQSVDMCFASQLRYTIIRLWQGQYGFVCQVSPRTINCCTAEIYQFRDDTFLCGIDDFCGTPMIYLFKKMGISI